MEKHRICALLELFKQLLHGLGLCELHHKRLTSHAATEKQQLPTFSRDCLMIPQHSHANTQFLSFFF